MEFSKNQLSELSKKLSTEFNINNEDIFIFLKELGSHNSTYISVSIEQRFGINWNDTRAVVQAFKLELGVN